MKYKKGSTNDLILTVIIGFGMVVVGLIALRVFSDINTQFQASDSVSAGTKATLTAVGNKLPAWIDGGFLLFWVVLFIAGMFLAMQINTNPVFFPISIFYFIVLTFISYLFRSVYLQLVASSVLSTQAGLLSIIPFIVPRLHYFSFVFGILTISLMVIKRSGDGG